MNTKIKILTEDHYTLSARHFIPDQSTGHTVIINTATGVKQTFYSQFADFLSKEGFHVYTYDYRGIGESRNGSLKKFRATLADWGERDLTAVIRYAKERHPANTLSLIGHSIGGQIIGLSPMATEAGSIVMIAAQTPYWKHFGGIMKLKVWQLWHVMIPLLTKVCTYFPARRLGLFEDLPGPVALQWASWGKNSHYLFNDLPEKRKMFSSLRQPALVFSFSDDSIAPLKAVHDLLKFYNNLKIDHRHVHPSEINKKSIGHFYFFRKNAEDVFWKSVSDWLKTTGEKRSVRRDDLVSAAIRHL